MFGFDFHTYRLLGSGQDKGRVGELLLEDESSYSLEPHGCRLNATIRQNTRTDGAYEAFRPKSAIAFSRMIFRRSAALIPESLETVWTGFGSPIS
jgi:hypothetical protein